MPKKTERRDLLGFFTIHSVAKHQKIEGMKIFYFRKKISQCRKKLKGGTIWNFPTSILSQNSKKLKGTLWRQKKFRKKSRTVPKKTQRGDPIVSSGFVSYDKNGVTEMGGPFALS